MNLLRKLFEDSNTISTNFSADSVENPTISKPKPIIKPIKPKTRKVVDNTPGEQQSPADNQKFYLSKSWTAQKHGLNGMQNSDLLRLADLDSNPAKRGIVNNTQVKPNNFSRMLRNRLQDRVDKKMYKNTEYNNAKDILNSYKSIFKSEG